MKNEVYIYELQDNGTTFYVGQTQDLKSRIPQHITLAKSKLDAKGKRIRDIISKGRELTYKIVCKCDIKDGNTRERQRIELHLSLGNDIVNKMIPFDRQIKVLNKPNNPQFSDKERKILQAMADDKTTEEITQIVWLSDRTIETIRRNIKDKAGCKTIAGLIAYAIKNNLVTIPPQY